MWSNLPIDLLANIFSYLPPDSLARAKTACRSWRAATECEASHHSRHSTPWFVAFPTRGRGLSCYVNNPIAHKWHFLPPLDHITSPIRPIATIGGLVLLRITSTTSLQLAISNPFTGQFRALPGLNVARTNPAVGVLDGNNSSKNSPYTIYVAGGMSDGAGRGAAYQPTIEMYDVRNNTWRIVGPMPVEFAVRLTVWTPNESVHSRGVLYWMTSARAYSVMGYEIRTNKWRELSVPIADKLEFAVLVARNGNPTLVGGTCGRDACVWELGEGDVWSVVGRVPYELGARLLGENKPNWDNVKCVGVDGAVCLYRDIGSGVIVWREVFGKWEWDWIEGCCSVRGMQIQNFPIRGLLLHPDLAHSSVI